EALRREQRRLLPHVAAPCPKGPEVKLRIRAIARPCDAPARRSLPGTGAISFQPPSRGPARDRPQPDQEAGSSPPVEPVGMVTVKQVPPSGGEPASIRPPWSSTIWRQT